MSSGREYSDQTARILDEEISTMLHAQQERARELLIKHRVGLDLVAEALLEHETIDGPEVARLIQQGLGERTQPVALEDAAPAETASTD